MGKINVHFAERKDIGKGSALSVQGNQLPPMLVEEVDWSCRGSAGPQEPRTTLTVGAQKVDFLVELIALTQALWWGKGKE